MIGSIETKEQYIDAVLEAIEEMEAKFLTMKITFLISVNRAAPVESATEAVDLLTTFREKNKASDTPNKVVGLELSGDPRVGDFSTFIEEFKRAQDNGFKVSLHCAEVKDRPEECQTMIDFKPDRLGHCCYLTND